MAAGMKAMPTHCKRSTATYVSDAGAEREEYVAEVGGGDAAEHNCRGARDAVAQVARQVVEQDRRGDDDNRRRQRFVDQIEERCDDGVHSG